MRFHKVEIDNEIFEYVKKYAEPLTDTFNSALRRLLLTSTYKPNKIKQKASVVTQNNSLMPNLPNHTPQALRHPLEVAYLVLHSNIYNRPEATRYVANQHNVTPQTVMDKYCRQLNLRAIEFDSLLEQPNLTDLKNILKTKFTNYKVIIENILG